MGILGEIWRWIFPDPAIALLGLSGFGLLVFGLPRFDYPRLQDAPRWALLVGAVIGAAWVASGFWVPHTMATGPGL